MVAVALSIQAVVLALALNVLLAPAARLHGDVLFVCQVPVAVVLATVLAAFGILQSLDLSRSESGLVLGLVAAGIGDPARAAFVSATVGRAAAPVESPERLLPFAARTRLHDESEFAIGLVGSQRLDRGCA